MSHLGLPGLQRAPGRTLAPPTRGSAYPGSATSTLFHRNRHQTPPPSFLSGHAGPRRTPCRPALASPIAHKTRQDRGSPSVPGLHHLCTIPTVTKPLAGTRRTHYGAHRCAPAPALAIIHIPRPALLTRRHDLPRPRPPRATGPRVRASPAVRRTIDPTRQISMRMYAPQAACARRAKYVYPGSAFDVAALRHPHLAMSPSG